MQSYLRQLRENSKKYLFPSSVSGPITLYSEHKNPITAEVSLIRCVLEGCFWKQESINIFKKTGQQTRNAVMVYIPYAKEITGREYVTPKIWNSLENTDGYWTLDMKHLPLAVNGLCEYEFLSFADSRIAVQEKQFLEQYEARRIIEVNPHFYGDISMYHIQARC